MNIRKSLTVAAGLLFLFSNFAVTVPRVGAIPDDPQCTGGGTRHFGVLIDCGYFSPHLHTRPQGTGNVVGGGLLSDSKYNNNFNVDDFISQVSGGGIGGQFIISTMTGGGDINELRRRVQSYKNRG